MPVHETRKEVIGGAAGEMAVTPNCGSELMVNDSELRWYPMRVAYGRAERMERLQAALERRGIESFMVWRNVYERTDDFKVRKTRVPAVNGLIFVHSTQEEITRLKMTKSEFEPLRYYVNQITDRLTGKATDRILTVPDGEMANFMRVYERAGEKAALLEYTEFIAKAGKRVRVTQGDFAGTVGTIKRIKKTQCVVVQLEGFAALALAFVPLSWLEELTEDEYREAMHF